MHVWIEISENRKQPRSSCSIKINLDANCTCFSLHKQFAYK